VTTLAVFAAAELVLIAYLVFEYRRMGRDHIAQVDRLCQRLQAPGAAVLEHDEAVRERPPEDYAPPGLEPDDDAGYWASREKLAEFAMNEEMASDGRDG
jgi:hypothetical protein